MTKMKWDPNLYDASHNYVSKYGSNVLELLDPKKGEKILDVGCGTGDLANELYEKGINVEGVDQSPTMIEQAKEKYPHIPFHIADITNLSFEDNFDAIFSNAVLHWVKTPETALQNMYKSLRPSGRLVAEFGGKGNVENLTSTIINQVREAGYSFDEKHFPWYFPSIADYSIFMEKVGFQVTFAHLYDRPTPLQGEKGLINWIKMFAETFLNDVPLDKQNEVIKQVEQKLKKVQFKDNKWIADYIRLQVIGYKL